MEESTQPNAVPPEVHGSVLERAERQRNPYAGQGIPTITIYAGGRHVYLPAKWKAQAGITDRVTIYHDKRPGIITFTPATQWNYRRSFGCRTGMCGATIFPVLFGYIPTTRYVLVDVVEGAIRMRLADLYVEAPVVVLPPRKTGVAS